MEGPGPGAYGGIGSNYKGGYGMGKAPRSAAGARKDGAPGPGAYNGGVSAFDKNKGPSFKGRYGSGKGKGNMYDSPGPGAYNYDKDPTKQSAPAFKMGGRHEIRNNANNPGPQYDPNTFAIKPSAPAVGFGKAGRSGMRGGDNPGPGNYNARSSFGKGGFKMGSEQRGKTGKGGTYESPGPGAYQ